MLLYRQHVLMRFVLALYIYSVFLILLVAYIFHSSYPALSMTFWLTMLTYICLILHVCQADDDNLCEYNAALCFSEVYFHLVLHLVG